MRNPRSPYPIYQRAGKPRQPCRARGACRCRSRERCPPPARRCGTREGTCRNSCWIPGRRLSGPLPRRISGCRSPRPRTYGPRRSGRGTGRGRCPRGPSRWHVWQIWRSSRARRRRPPRCSGKACPRRWRSRSRRHSGGSRPPPRDRSREIQDVPARPRRGRTPSASCSPRPRSP